MSSELSVQFCSSDLKDKKFRKIKKNPKNPKNIYEERAVEGFKFCNELLSMIDYMQAKVDNISFGEMREVLTLVVNLIKSNIKKYDSSIQFQHVSDLIFEIVPSSTKNSRVIRDQQFAKAKTGLSRILSLSLTMLEDLSKLEISNPDKFEYKNVSDIDIDDTLPKRFKPQRANLSIYDIIDFIYQHGDLYGINSKDEWEIVFRDDPELTQDITTVINAVNRGHVPRAYYYIKEEITKALNNHKKRKSSNAHIFDTEEI